MVGMVTPGQTPFNPRAGEAAMKTKQWGQKPIKTGFFTAFPQTDENLSAGGMGYTTTAGTSREQAQKLRVADDDFILYLWSHLSDSRGFSWPCSRDNSKAKGRLLLSVVEFLDP